LAQGHGLNDHRLCSVDEHALARHNVVLQPAQAMQKTRNNVFQT
jgi:hypothetical protein